MKGSFNPQGVTTLGLRTTGVVSSGLSLTCMLFFCSAVLVLWGRCSWLQGGYILPDLTSGLPQRKRGVRGEK